MTIVKTLILAFLAPLLLWSQSGILDPSFGTNGVHSIRVDSLDDFIIKSLVSSDGSVYSMGSYSSISDVNGWDAYFFLKQTSEGKLDSSFALNGILKDKLNVYAGLSDFIIFPDGCILAGGSAGFAPYYPLLIKLKPDGSYDASFGDNGKLIFSPLFPNRWISGITLSSTGDIIAAINFDGGVTHYDAGYMKLFPDGTPDKFFGNYSIALCETPVEVERAITMQLQKDDKVVLCGFQYIDQYDQSNGFFTRFNSDGSLDSSFAVNGLAKIKHPGQDTFCKLLDMVIQDDGKIVGCGYTIFETAPGGFSYDNAYFLVRLLPDGTLDPSFGKNGIVTTQLDGNAGHPRGVALQKDGKIVCVGRTDGSFYTYIVVSRFNTNGSLDTSFHQKGYVLADLTKTESQTSLDVTIGPDENIFVSGEAREFITKSSYNSFVAKFLASDPVSTTNISEETEIILYPNPTNDFIKINTHSGMMPNKIVLQNCLGQLIQVPFSNNTIDVHFLPAGIYFVSIYISNQWVNKKILIQHR